MNELNLLKELEFFKETPIEILEEISKSSHIRIFEQNEYILKQNDEARNLFFLIRGHIQFLIHFEGVDHFLVGTSDKPGTVLGWSCFRLPHRYTASIRAEDKCEVLQIPRYILEKAFDENPRFGYEFLKKIAKSLASRLEQTRDYLVTSKRKTAESGVTS